MDVSFLASNLAFNDFERDPFEDSRPLLFCLAEKVDLRKAAIFVRYDVPIRAAFFFFFRSGERTGADAIDADEKRQRF